MRIMRFLRTPVLLLLFSLVILAGGTVYGKGRPEQADAQAENQAHSSAQENTSETTDTTQNAQSYKEAPQLKELIENENEPYTLVDVRTDMEYSGGFIPTALNIPVQNIEENPPETAKDQLVIVYCRSGARSAQAKEILTELGYTRVINFGGIGSWPYELEEP